MRHMRVLSLHRLHACVVWCNCVSVHVDAWPTMAEYLAALRGTVLQCWAAGRSSFHSTLTKQHQQLIKQTLNGNMTSPHRGTRASRSHPLRIVAAKRSSKSCPCSGATKNWSKTNKTPTIAHWSLQQCLQCPHLFRYQIWLTPVPSFAKMQKHRISAIISILTFLYILSIFQQFPCAEALAAPRQVRWQSARLHIALWDTCCKSHSSTKCEKARKSGTCLLSLVLAVVCIFGLACKQQFVCLWNWRPNLFEHSLSCTGWTQGLDALACRGHQPKMHQVTPWHPALWNKYILKNSISSSTPFRSMQSFGSPSRLSFSLPPPGDRTHRGQNKTQSIHHTQFSPVD